MAFAKVDAARKAFAEQIASGGMANNEANAAAAQAVTEARYAQYAETKSIYPTEYPKPQAGDGSGVFKHADEAGEGIVTRKEMSKYIARNLSTIKMLLAEGFEQFNAEFSIEDLRDMHKDEFCALWLKAAGMRAEAEAARKQDVTAGHVPGASETDRSALPPTSLAPEDKTEEKQEEEKPKKAAASYQEIVPEGADFKFSLGHQEMSRVMKALEDIFRSQPCDWLPVDAMANLLSVELAYEDTAEFEDALGGEFSDFVHGLPNAELSVNERGTKVLKLKKDEPGPPRTMTLKVEDRKQLWHVLMQAPDAAIEIPELEFEFQPMGERKIDTIYNHIASAVWNLGCYVRDAQGQLTSDSEGKILDTIMLLNKCLDVEHPFTVIVRDPTSRSLWQPITGVDVKYADDDQAQAA